MCDCGTESSVDLEEAHWFWKLITGLVLGALIFETVKPQ